MAESFEDALAKLLKQYEGEDAEDLIDALETAADELRLGDDGGPSGDSDE